MIFKYYRVLDFYDISYNKWIMPGEMKAWGDRSNVEDKRDYKIVICMIEDGVLTEFDDIDLTDYRYNLRYIYKIVNSNDIIAVKRMYNQISVEIRILFLGFD